MTRFLPRLSYANVVATLALFIALGGASYAAFKLPKNSVGSKQLKKNAVTTAKIRNGAVTGAKIKLATLGTVPSASHTGNADHATTADRAGTAEGLSAPESVHYVGQPGEPSLGPSFIAGVESLGFYKDRACTVHLLGEVTGPSSGTAFILPEADWPEKQQFEAIAVSGGASGNVEVVTDGEIRPYTGGTGSHNFGLGGVTFRAASC